MTGVPKMFGMYKHVGHEVRQEMLCGSFAIADSADERVSRWKWTSLATQSWTQALWRSSFVSLASGGLHRTLCTPIGK